MPDSQSNKYYTVSIDAVKKALEILSGSRSHEHFPGYLALLRDRCNATTLNNSETIVKFYKDYLSVIDAPEKRPFLRPFRSRGLDSAITLYQQNVAGSYAPSSIRSASPLSKVIDINKANGVTSYKLHDEHWKTVLAEMLSGQKISILSVAIFLFRDYAFQMEHPNLYNLVSVFRNVFSISSKDENGDEIYETLFSDDSSEYSDQVITKVEAEIKSLDYITKIRDLSLVDLGLGNLSRISMMENAIIPRREMEIEDFSQLDINDPVLRQVKRAIELNYAGILISGPPGTGKSWYAQQIGVALCGSWRAVRTVQFHPSYQYEDFVFGYVAQKDGTFLLTEKEFVITCRTAAADPDRIYCLIIDEISRTDIIRIFGEALTYLERDKRDQPFKTASGEELSVPSNLLLIGTMNPWDKGVDEIDIALERRFAQIELNPDVEVLRRLLLKKTTDPFIDRVIEFFSKLIQNDFDGVHLGHAYFMECIDINAASDIWAFRIKPTLKRACRLNNELFTLIESEWNNIVVRGLQENIENLTAPENSLSNE